MMVRFSRTLTDDAQRPSPESVLLQRFCLVPLSSLGRRSPNQPPLDLMTFGSLTGEEREEAKRGAALLAGQSLARVFRQRTFKIRNSPLKTGESLFHLAEAFGRGLFAVRGAKLDRARRGRG